jgi:hypothetical protein
MGLANRSFNASDASRSVPRLGGRGAFSLVQGMSDGELYAPVEQRGANTPGDEVQQHRAAGVQACDHVRPSKKSNLDATRRVVVVKGGRVTCGGRWWHVVAVRMGQCCIRPLGDDSMFPCSEWTPCSNVVVRDFGPLGVS